MTIEALNTHFALSSRLDNVNCIQKSFNQVELFVNLSLNNSQKRLSTITA